MILGQWRAQTKRRQKAEALYRAVVSQTRRPEFYVNGRIADTFEGRFDLLVVHVALVLHRLKAGGKEGKALGQMLFDLLFADMDTALREMGVGDVSVPRRIRAMSEAFYGRLRAYDAGLGTVAESDGELSQALARNLYGDQTGVPQRNIAAMAAYMRNAASQLRNQTLEDLAPEALFPDPPPFDTGQRSPAKGAQ